MLNPAEKERSQNEKILRVVKESPPKDFQDATRFIISALGSGALGIQRKDKKTAFKTHKATFEGGEAVTWAMVYYHLENRESGATLFQILMDVGQIEDVDGKKEFKDDDKRNYVTTKTLFMYDVHLEKFRVDVETMIKEEIARRKGQTLPDKDKKDIRKRAQSTIKKATQSLKFARGPAPVWGTPSVLEVERDGRRLSVIRPDEEELKHTILRMSQAKSAEPREGATSPSSGSSVRIAASPPVSPRQALSPNARISPLREREEPLPPPPSRAAPQLARSGSPSVEPGSPLRPTTTVLPSSPLAQSTTEATETIAPKSTGREPEASKPSRTRPVTTALTKKEQAAVEKKPTILQVSPAMTSQAHIKEVLSDAQELLRMHRAGLTGKMTDGEWKGFALSGVDMLERLMGTVVALHMHKRKQEDDIRMLKSIINKKEPNAAIPPLSSTASSAASSSSPSRRAPTTAKDKDDIKKKPSRRDNGLLHDMRVEMAPIPTLSTAEADPPPKRASQSLPPEEKVSKPVMPRPTAVPKAAAPVPAAQDKTEEKKAAAAAPEKKADEVKKPAAVAASAEKKAEEKKPDDGRRAAGAAPAKDAQQTQQPQKSEPPAVEAYPENVAKRRKEIVAKLGYDLFEALKNPTYDASKLETYLTGHEFQACFLMSPADFAALPRHTQLIAKKNLGL